MHICMYMHTCVATYTKLLIILVYLVPVTTSGIYQQTGLRKLQTVTNANTTPGD